MSNAGRPDDRADVGVGDGGLGAATPVGGGTGLGTGRLGADLEQAELVDAGERTAAGADLDEVDRRDGAREAGALLEAVGACDLEHVGELGLATVDETGLGGGATHVEAHQTVGVESTGEPAAREGAGSRAALDQTDRDACRVVGGDDAAVREHHQHGAAEALTGEPLLQLLQVGADDRHRGGVAGRRDHARVLADLGRHVGRDAHRDTEFGGQVFGDESLVLAVHVRVQEAQADRLDLGGAQLLGERSECFGGRGMDEFAGRADALVEFERAIAGDRRRRELDLEVVHVVAVLVADEERVAEALGRDEAGAAGLALDQCVGDQRGGVHDRRRHVAGLDVGACEQRRDAGANPVEGVLRGGEGLVDHDVAGRCVEQHHVGEGPSDVDSDAPVGGHAVTSLLFEDWLFEFVACRSARGGANTSRIQHSSYSSSPMKIESPWSIVLGAR